jgi:hypothetical protein
LLERVHFQLSQVHEMELKKKRKEERPKVNLIFSHVNYTFCYWTPSLKTHSLYLKKFFFLNVKKDPIQGSICFKLVPGLLVPGPLSKVALSNWFLLFAGLYLSFVIFFCGLLCRWES